MAMGGDGPMAVAIMWVMVSLAGIFAALRLYTRAIVIKSYGLDDHAYNCAFICLVGYCSFITVAAHYGFGQSNKVLDPRDVSKAILFEAIGQTFAVVGMAVAKWSLGLFLLRLLRVPWHKTAVWVMMVLLMFASISTCFVFWLQCTPPAYLWDRTIEGGACEVDSTPVSMLLCVLCVVADFFFAIMPWIFMYNLQMNRREKLITLASLSLGVVAGAFGIKRTIEVPELSSDDYTKNTVGLIVWSAAEIAVTVICIGIPTCGPLWKRVLASFTTRGSSNEGGYRSGGDSPSAGAVFALHTFGGSTMLPRGTKGTKLEDAASQDRTHPTRSGDRPGQSKSYATSRAMGRRRDLNSSDESILGAHGSTDQDSAVS